MRIYISNLNSDITDDGLKKIFSQFGEVASAEISYDQFTEKSRGFGHVEMNDSDGKKAIQALNNTRVEDLVVTVQQTTDKQVHKGSYKVGSGIINEYRFKKN